MKQKKRYLAFLLVVTMTLMAGCSNVKNDYEAKNRTASSGQSDSPAENTAVTTIASPEELLEMEAEIIRQTNEYRVSLGLNELTQDDQLTDVARIRAQEIVTTWSHTRADGTKYVDILDAMQYPSPLVGENLGRYQDSVGEVMEMWKESPSHNDNLVEERFTKIGTGVFMSEDGFLHYVQIFAE